MEELMVPGCRQRLKVFPRSGFTLVEMISVLAIIGLLIGISIPVFNIIGSDRGVKADILKLNGVLRLARQHAIMKRAYTFVVFVDNFPGVLDEQRHRAYAVLQGTADEPETYVSPWHLLSKGIYFATMNETTWGPDATAVDIMADSSPVDCPYPESASGKQELLLIRYSPDGRCWAYDGTKWKLSAVFHVVLAPAIVDAAQQVVVSPTDYARTGNVVIAPRTGLNSLRLEPKRT